MSWEWKRAMKIAIIGHKHIPSNEGGIEKGVEMHAVRMVARGHTVLAYNRGCKNVFKQEDDLRSLRNYRGVRIVTVPTTSGRICVPLYSFLATLHAALSRCDVVSYRASGSCVMIPLAKLLGLRCVASLHGIDSQRDKWGNFAKRYLEFGERMAAKKADVCLVLSQRAKEYIKARYGTDAVRFANGVTEPQKLEPHQITERFGLEKQGYILSLGRLVPEKRIHDLIVAFHRCDTRKKLVIVGGAEPNSNYLDEMKILASGDERILFTGYLEGEILGELYSNAYLFALPSKLEGMANTLLEAMSYGCCCLVSDIPENTEVVGDHAACFRTGDVDDLCAQLQALLCDSGRVQEYRNNAAPFILERFNWDRVVDQMLEIYGGHIVEYQDMPQQNTQQDIGGRPV